MFGQSPGFSLIEALIAMALVAILACIAVPSWSAAREAAYNGSAQAALRESILTSITHATLTGNETILCPGDVNAGCRATIDWSSGWIAFADLDGDRIRDPGDPLLQASGPLGGNVHLRTTINRTRLVFQPNGGNAGSNVTFTLCDGRGPSKAITFVVANDGRMRPGQPTVTAATSCMVDM